MMQTFSDLAERSHLLWLQRDRFSSSDYITLTQLQQHDNRLLQSVRLCQRYLSQQLDLPLWLQALLDNRVAELDSLLALPLTLSAQVLLAELWLALQQKTKAHYFEQYCRSEQSLLLCLLADKPAASRLFDVMQSFDRRSAVQLAGQCGLTTQRAALLKQTTDHTLGAARLAELNYALYLLGQHSDEFELVLQLHNAECLTTRQLQLLLLGACTERKIRIVNALCSSDTALAVNAMGFSGLAKFCPVLLEITQEPAHRVAAQSALITMLGALAADNLQTELAADRQRLPADTTEPMLGGQLLNSLDFAACWASGNQYQRFAAAALRVLQTPGLALAEPNNWQGGLWPVA
ncbi:MAG: hypothetical protein CML20_14115 [Rheinheimera sp.]|uniref:hypothetical protein n=1 Tax=Arsukibacterium sp. UBA3155 TaxID=1946058 RepID=UPI000C8BD7BF|nr:hypothetical protein [Arsukibacterium sp. UBA3155]MAD75897.1 hypothetical protein [Rheinheimera sp.]|tara:strand:- start:59101 stop:60147 length:1047 start_codon:yes stop_codon:yes gene_type:complete